MTSVSGCGARAPRAGRAWLPLDILVNNIATQRPVDSLADVSTEEWDATFRTNLYSYFWCTQAALDHMPDGGAIINTGSVNGLRGNKSLLTYATTNGAVHIFNSALSMSTGTTAGFQPS